MNSKTFHKDNVYLFVFLILVFGTLCFTQAQKQAVVNDKTSATLNAETSSEHRSKESLAYGSSRTTARPKLMTTNSTPEKNQQVTFSLTDFSDSPDIKYYLKLGNEKINFEKGKLKHFFKENGTVHAELHVSYQNQDRLIDRLTIEVAQAVGSTPLASKLEEE
jgi:hypothetical protein